MEKARGLTLQNSQVYSYICEADYRCRSFCMLRRDKMVTIKQHDLLECLKEGIEEAGKLSGKVLVSYTKPLVSIDPLLFYYNGNKLYKGNRTYLSDTEGITMVGLGAAFVQSTEGNERFKKTEEAWQLFLKNAIIHNDSQVRGTGPIFMGGFSFKPEGKCSSLWSGFSQTDFVVPNWLLTDVGTQSYLTMNVLVDKQSDLETLHKELEGIERKLLEKADWSMSTPKSKLIIEENRINEWLSAVQQSIEDIQNKELDKVVLSRMITVASDQVFDIIDLISALHERQQDSYIFAFEKAGSTFIGATPERLISKTGTRFDTTCLAGTIGRGQTEKEDQQLGEALLSDQKNREEHQMVVSMISESMEKVCHKVIKPDFPQLYKAKDVQHLYTPITGIAGGESSILSLVEALHPTPAMGGVPRERAIKLIEERETYERGWYSAPVGWLDNNGDGEFIVAIRSGLIKNKTATLFAGCGIVADSNPQSEYQETKMKFKPMLTALGGQ